MGQKCVVLQSERPSYIWISIILTEDSTHAPVAMGSLALNRPKGQDITYGKDRKSWFETEREGEGGREGEEEEEGQREKEEEREKEKKKREREGEREWRKRETA